MCFEIFFDVECSRFFNRHLTIVSLEIRRFHSFIPGVETEKITVGYLRGFWRSLFLNNEYDS